MSDRKIASSTSWVMKRTVGARSAQTSEQPLLHVGAGEGVERAERLVEQQQRAAGEDGAQEGDPLPHAAGELRPGRPPRSRPGRSGPSSARARAWASGRGTPCDVQRQHGVVEERPPGQQQVALRHVADEAGAAGDVGGRRADAAGVGPVEAGDEAEERALAAAGRTDERDEGARRGRPDDTSTSTGSRRPSGQAKALLTGDRW